MNATVSKATHVVLLKCLVCVVTISGSWTLLNAVTDLDVCVSLFAGPEGALFQHSVEVPQLRSEMLKELR